MITKPLNYRVFQKMKSLFSNLQVAADFFHANQLPPVNIKYWLSGSHAFSDTEIDMVENYFGLNFRRPVIKEVRPLPDLVYEAIKQAGKAMILHAIYRNLKEKFPAMHFTRNSIHRILEEHPLISEYYFHSQHWYVIKQFESEWKSAQSGHVIDKIYEFIMEQRKPVHLDEIEKYLYYAYQLDQHQIRVIIKSDSKRRCVFVGKGYYDVSESGIKPSYKKRHYTINDRGNFFVDPHF